MAAMAISNNLNELDTLLQVGQGMKKCIDYYEEVVADQHNDNCQDLSVARYSGKFMEVETSVETQQVLTTC